VSTKTNTTPKEGALRVWHIPQVPGAAFRVDVIRTDSVNTVETTEGVLIAVDRPIEQLHAAIRHGARILSATVDEEVEARLDEFMAATALPTRKTKLPRR